MQMGTRQSSTKKLQPVLLALLGTVVGISLAVLGMALISKDHTNASYGYSMFIILPLATGMVIGCFSRSIWWAVVSVLLVIVVGLGLMLIGGLEGVICILMAFPLLCACALFGVLLAAFISWLVRKTSGPGSHMVVLPLIGFSMIFAADKVENRLPDAYRVETVTTSRVLVATPEKIWSRILSVDEVSGKKPWLLYIGLPVPKSCTMEGSGIGARRVCYFETGAIEEEVTHWEPGRRLDLKIVRSTLPGRHWLQFESASYELEPLSATETRLTRRTTISSKLCPGWYWRFFEDMGIQAEHRYLFDSVFSDGK
jgi:hypothetical protein